MKRILSFLIIVCLCFSFSACDNSSDTNIGNSSKSSEETKYNSSDSYSSLASETSDKNEESSKNEVSSKPEESSKNEVSSKPEESSKDEVSSKPENTDIIGIPDGLLNKTVSFESDDFDNLMELFDGIIFEYPYQELYGIEETYEQYLNLPDYVSTHENYFADGFSPSRNFLIS